jgi:hypothetical protein
MGAVHGEAEDYLGPREAGHEHALGLGPIEVETTPEAEEYIGPHIARDRPGEPEGLVQGRL